MPLPEFAVLRTLTRDGRLILAARALRLFAFGALSLVFALYFTHRGWDESRTGRLMAIAMAGDAAITLLVTLHADRLGRARLLRLGAALMLLAGVALPLASAFWLAALVAFFGAISFNGGEVGPFLAIEQAALTQTSAATRTTAIAWYILCGTLASALGALTAGALVRTLVRAAAWTPLDAYRAIFALYALCGALLWWLFVSLSPAIEAAPASSVAPGFGLHRSRGIVLRLAALFAVDTFGSGLVVQSFLAWWLARRFSLDAAAIGAILFGMNLLGAFSALAAGRLAARIGLVATMVWTHIPANLLLMALPLVPSLPLAVALLLLRGCLSQMDVPARQSYLMAVVDPGERSAAGGVTGLAKSLAAAVSPPLTGMLFASGWLSAPFLLGGGLKIAYDLALWRSFRRLRPPEEE